jgi:1,4-alpha-glucan branching enzyme
MNKKAIPQRISSKYQAPEATSVSLVGTCNGWNVSAHPLKKDTSGIRSTAVNLLPGTHESLYAIDGEWRKFSLLTIITDLNETLTITRE